MGENARELLKIDAGMKVLSQGFNDAQFRNFLSKVKISCSPSKEGLLRTLKCLGR
jgi:hypothetical protein